MKKSSEQRNRFFSGTLQEREVLWHQWYGLRVQEIRSHRLDLSGITREVWRVSSTEFHIYDAERLDRLRRAYAVWVDLGSEEDSPGLNAAISILLARRQRPVLQTALSFRSFKQWCDCTKLRDGIILDIGEAFDAV